MCVRVCETMHLHLIVQKVEIEAIEQMASGLEHEPMHPKIASELPTLHSLHCTAYVAPPTLRSLHCTAYIEKPTLHGLRCMAYIQQPTFHSLHCTAYIAKP